MVFVHTINDDVHEINSEREHTFLEASHPATHRTNQVAFLCNTRRFIFFTVHQNEVSVFLRAGAKHASTSLPAHILQMVPLSNETDGVCVALGNGELLLIEAIVSLNQQVECTTIPIPTKPISSLSHLACHVTATSQLAAVVSSGTRLKVLSLTSGSVLGRIKLHTTTLQISIIEKAIVVASTKGSLSAFDPNNLRGDPLVREWTPHRGTAVTGLHLFPSTPPRCMTFSEGKQELALWVLEEGAAEQHQVILFQGALAQRLGSSRLLLSPDNRIALVFDSLSGSAAALELSDNFDSVLRITNWKLCSDVRVGSLVFRMVSRAGSAVEMELTLTAIDTSSRLFRVCFNPSILPISTKKPVADANVDRWFASTTEPASLNGRTNEVSTPQGFTVVSSTGVRGSPAHIDVSIEASVIARWVENTTVMLDGQFLEFGDLIKQIDIQAQAGLSLLKGPAETLSKESVRKLRDSVTQQNGDKRDFAAETHLTRGLEEVIHHAANKALMQGVLDLIEESNTKQADLLRHQIARDSSMKKSTVSQIETKTKALTERFRKYTAMCHTTLGLTHEPMASMVASKDLRALQEFVSTPDFYTFLQKVETEHNGAGDGFDAIWLLLSGDACDEVSWRERVELAYELVVQFDSAFTLREGCNETELSQRTGLLIELVAKLGAGLDSEFVDLRRALTRIRLALQSYEW